jgi:hypothetical protein
MLFPTYEDWLKKLWEEPFFLGDTQENLKARYAAARARAMPFQGGWPEEVLPTASEYLIDGLLPRSAFALMFGHRGTGKTFQALDMANSGALALPFQGHSVKDPFGSAYFVGEKKHGFDKRNLAWSKNRSLVGTSRPRLYVVYGVPNLLEERSVTRTIDYLNEVVRPALEGADLPLEAMFLDTLMRAVPGHSVSDQSVASRAAEAIARIVDEAGVTVVALAHVAKAKAGVRQDASAKGAGEWEDTADTVFKLDRVGLNPVRTMTVTKQSDGPEGGKAAFELEQIEVGQDKYGRPITSCVAKVATHGGGAGKGKSIGPGALEALDHANCMFSEKLGVPFSPKGNPTGRVDAISLRALRERMLSRGFRASTRPDPTDAQAHRVWLDSGRRAIDRAVASLVEGQKLHREGDWIWIASPD